MHRSILSCLCPALRGDGVLQISRVPLPCHLRQVVAVFRVLSGHGAWSASLDLHGGLLLDPGSRLSTAALPSRDGRLPLGCPCSTRAKGEVSGSPAPFQFLK